MTNRALERTLRGALLSAVIALVPASCASPDQPSQLTASPVSAPDASSESTPDSQPPASPSAAPTSTRAGKDAAAGSRGGTLPTGSDAGRADAASEASTAGMDDPGADDSGERPQAEPSEAGPHLRGPEPTAESASKAGPYKVERYSEGFRDGKEFGAATIWYPGDAEPPFAMIVFCPGWLGTQMSDARWAPFMASHGIVFMNIDTNTVGDSVTQRKAALWDALASLKAENTRADSPLLSKLDASRVSLMGWSMGGGGSWLNAVEHPELKAVVTLAGHNATAGGAERNRGLSVPVLMFAGTADTAVLGLGMSQPVYQVVPESTPKMLYEVQGADHFDFNDPAFLDGAIGRYALAWQKVFLEGDSRYRKLLLDKGPMASDFRTNLE